MNVAKSKHPSSLYMLFLVTMWERFSFYGMRALLVLYLVSEKSRGGLSWTSEQAGSLYGTYNAVTYLATFLGGYLADKYIGFRRSVLIGGILIALGHISLSIDSLFNFYLGLILIIIGTGSFKPSASSMVGELYEDGSPLKDSAYSIFYIGINLGAFLGALVCGYLGENVGWHYGFGAAAVGMVAGLILFLFRQHTLGQIGLKPIKKSAEEKLAQVPFTKVEKQRIYVICFLSFFSILFWLAFEQAGASMNIYALKYTDRFVGKTLNIDEYRIKADKHSVNDSVILGEASLWLNQYNGKVPTDTIQARFSKHPVLFWVKEGVYYSGTKENYELLQKRYNSVDSAKLYLSDYINVNSIKKNKKELIDQELASLKISYKPIKVSTQDEFKVVALNKQQSALIVPASWFQSVNAFFIFALAPLFSMLWLWLSKRHRNPSAPIKFVLGLVLLAVGFVALVIGSASIKKGSLVGSSHMMWLVMAYFFHTLGELCLSPVGMSFVNKLSPKRVLGLMFGIWFLCSGIAHYAGGILSGMIDQFAEKSSMASFFLLFVVIGGISAILLALISPLLKRWMNGVS